MFGVLAPDVVKRIAIIPGVPLTLPGEVQAQVFMVPGKLPLYLEGENPEIASETAANVGVEISAHNARMVYIPGAAAMTQRIKGADVVFFDGTPFRDDEMITSETGAKTGRRLDWIKGHVALSSSAMVHKPLGLLAELTHRCPLGCPYCSKDLVSVSGNWRWTRDSSVCLSGE
jgi:pyrroloquinoline quinone biosynthesis protein B